MSHLIINDSNSESLIVHDDPQKIVLVFMQTVTVTWKEKGTHHTISQYIIVYHSIPQYTIVYYTVYYTVYHIILQYTTVHHSITQHITAYYTKYHSTSQYTTVYHALNFLCDILKR